MQLTLLLFLIIAAVTQSFGDLLDGLEHDHHDHHEDHHDHHEDQLDHHKEKLEEVLDDHDLKSLDHDDSVPFSDDQYELQLLNEISRFLPREEFSVATHDDDKSSEVSLFRHLANPGRPKSFSVQEPVQQPLIVKQPIPEFGVPLKIIPPVQRQTTKIELQEPSQEFGIPRQEIQAAHVVEQLIINPNQHSVPAEPFAIIPKESFDFDSKETFRSSIEDLRNLLPHPVEEVVVVPSLPVTNTVVVPNPPAIQKVQSPPLINKVIASNPSATKARVASSPESKPTSSPTVKAVVQTNTLTAVVPDTVVVNVVNPAFDSLSSPFLSSDPSHSDFDDFSDNSIGGQGRQLGPVRNEAVPTSSRAFDLLEGDYPSYGPYPPAPQEFSCEDHDEGGYYADPEFNCQVFHVCFNQKLLGTFLCPNRTLFNQKFFVCDWWFNVDCAEANSFYYLNENIGKVPEKKENIFETDDDDDDFDD